MKLTYSPVQFGEIYRLSMDYHQTNPFLIQNAADLLSIPSNDYGARLALSADFGPQRATVGVFTNEDALDIGEGWKAPTDYDKVQATIADKFEHVKPENELDINTDDELREFIKTKIFKDLELDSEPVMFTLEEYGRYLDQKA